MANIIGPFENFTLGAASDIAVSSTAPPANPDTFFDGAGGNDSLTGGVGDDLIFGDTNLGRIPALAYLNETSIGDYLEQTNVSGLSGSRITVEMLVQADTPDSSTSPALFSYGVPGDFNEFTIFTNGSEFLRLIVNDAFIDTDIPLSALYDGDLHRLSVTWDGIEGEIAFWIDGVREWSASGQTGVLASPVASGGTLILGQDQDSPGGGFQSSQAYRGGIGDIRVFSDIRTENEIRDYAFDAIPNDLTEVDDLERYYQVDPVAGTLTEMLGSSVLTRTGAVRYAAPDFAGATGNDMLSGGAGIDTLISGTGNDTLNGGDGFDFASYFSVTNGVNINLAAPSSSNTGQGVDQFVAIEGVIGSDTGSDTGNDFLFGDQGDNILRGAGGDDRLYGDEDSLAAGGDDTLAGGAGDDWLFGVGGTDTADYRDANGFLRIDLNTEFQNSLSSSEGIDRLVSIENIIGANLGNQLTSTSRGCSQGSETMRFTGLWATTCWMAGLATIRSSARRAMMSWSAQVASTP